MCLYINEVTQLRKSLSLFNGMVEVCGLRLNLLWLSAFLFLSGFSFYFFPLHFLETSTVANGKF